MPNESNNISYNSPQYHTPSERYPASIFASVQPLHTRHTYFDNGKWRIKIKDVEYSDFPWIDRLAAFEDLGLEPSDVQKAYDICAQFLNVMGDISLAEIQEYAKAKEESRVSILPEGTKCACLNLSRNTTAEICTSVVADHQTDIPVQSMHGQEQPLLEAQREPKKLQPIGCVSVKIPSDYDPNTFLRLTRTDDGDIVLKIIGNGEMRIATSGGCLHGYDLAAVTTAFGKVLEVYRNKED